MRSYSYSEFQIEEIVQAEKYPRDWSNLEFERVGEHSRQAERILELEDGRFANLRFIVKAGRLNLVSTYEAALVLESQRIRGVGFAEIEKVQFYGRVIVPKGWHQNIVNLNLMSGEPDYNRHDALPKSFPSDLIDFTRKVANIWNIVLPGTSLL